MHHHIEQTNQKKFYANKTASSESIEFPCFCFVFFPRKVNRFFFLQIFNN